MRQITRNPVCGTKSHPGRFWSTHTSEIELAGNDVRGIGVHLAARVMAVGDPGQILVRRTMRDRVVGVGIGFVEGGTHAL